MAGEPGKCESQAHRFDNRSLVSIISGSAHQD
jgi:hypothetical protein